MFGDLLRQRLAGVVEVSPGQVEALETHYQLLLRWNRALNLTSIKRMEEAVERHYCESLFLGTHLPQGPLRIADIGSGAGFPGLPVALLRPDCSVTLIESHQRKAVFLSEASRNLPNVRVLATRAEDVKERFDWAISRAVSYQDLASFLKNLAANVDLLTGGEAPPNGIGFVWQAPIPVPWSRKAFLRIGHQDRVGQQERAGD
jgi:16S rRNA (guanine(527)-N(7))-methyltransferase RsmG